MKQIQNKKAEMSLTVVVAAVLALVVLVVLIYIFINSSQKSSSTFGSCEINGGVCGSNSCSTTGTIPIAGVCADKNAICCSNAKILG